MTTNTSTNKMDFNPDDDTPALTGKVILITGGTDGLGKESVRQLSLHSPAHIYFTARSTAKAQNVLAELDQRHPNHAPVSFLECDLASLASVKALATTLLSQINRLDILMCNAGTISASGSTTQDGYELSFGVNHLAHALLIKLLLPLLTATPDARCVVLSAAGEKWAPQGYTFTQMKSPLTELSHDKRYAQSKRANIQYTAELAARFKSVLFVSVHPGVVRTNFSAHYFEGRPVVRQIARVLAPWFMTVVDVQEGVKTQLWAATVPKEQLVNGEFYVPIGQVGAGSEASRDESVARELWDWTEEQLEAWI